MRKISILLTFMALVWFSCTKDMLLFTGFDCGEEAVTYELNMKSIVDAKCATAGCHIGTPNVEGIYTSYEGMRLHFGNQILNRVVNDRGTNQSMPPPGSDTLTTAEFMLFSCWIDQDFREN